MNTLNLTWNLKSNMKKITQSVRAWALLDDDNQINVCDIYKTRAGARDWKDSNNKVIKVFIISAENIGTLGL
jgi:hypothetical protein